MPIYNVMSQEKHLYRCFYQVEAVSEAEAVKLCMSGKVDYEEKEVMDDPGEWIETESVSEWKHSDD